MSTGSPLSVQSPPTEPGGRSQNSSTLDLQALYSVSGKVSGSLDSKAHGTFCPCLLGGPDTNPQGREASLVHK